MKKIHHPSVTGTRQKPIMYSTKLINNYIDFASKEKVTIYSGDNA
jgi:hypothetical protein